MNNTKNSPIKLDHLTGLRFFAAALVFLSHVKLNEPYDFFQKIFENGYVGVSFFFVLSGFVISYSYGERLKKGVITFKKYIFLRFARLTPLYFATLLPFIFYSIFTNEFNIWLLLTNILYVQSLFPSSDIYFSFNAPAWSLSNEMFFYLSFVVLIQYSLMNLFRFFIILFILVFLSAVFINVFFNDVILFGSNNISHWLFYIFPGFRLIEFIAGIIIFRIWNIGFAINSFFILPSFFLLICAMYFANNVIEELRFSLFFLPFIGFFLFSHLNGKGNVNKILKSKIFVLLGNSSFAFYLLHLPMLNIITKFITPMQFGDVTFLIVSFLIITIFSIIIHLCFEKYIERKFKILINRPL